MSYNSFDPTTIVSTVFANLPDEEPLTKNHLRESLVNAVEPLVADGSLDADKFNANYLYVFQKVYADIDEIDKRLIEIKRLYRATPSSETDVRKKLIHFAKLNKTARQEIMSFLSNDLHNYLVEHKTVDYPNRQNDELLNLSLDGRYNYSSYRRYYDHEYDFSTEVKINYIPGITIHNFLKRIEAYIELKAQNHPGFQEELSRMIKDNDVLSCLCTRVEVHNVLNKRLEVFNALKILYNEEKWQSFICLALLQIEGVFFDYCMIKKGDAFSGTAGKLFDKVKAVFKDNPKLMYSAYPYYAYDVPAMRNEIAHTGMINHNNPQHLANELILDLNTIISWVYTLSHDKYVVISMIYNELKEEVSTTPNNAARILLHKMLSCAAVTGFDYLDFLKNPALFSDEVKYMKTPVGYWDSIAQQINDIIKTKEFWEILAEFISPPDKIPTHILGFTKKIKNTFIPVLTKNSPAHIACRSVDKKLREIL